MQNGARLLAIITTLHTAGPLAVSITKMTPMKIDNRKKHKILTYCIAVVWLVNGLFCKVLNLVPRHEQIVARILGDEYAQPLTLIIGLAEIVMAIWILTRFKSRLNAITQIAIVATMNIIEFIAVPDLLLWGKLNIIFAFMFIGLVYYNEFVLKNTNPPIPA